MHPLALAGFLPFGERDENPRCRVDAGRAVGDGDAGPHGTAAGFARHPHQAAHALRDLVDAGTGPVGAGLAEARDRRQNDALIEHAQVGVVDAEPVLDVGPVVLDDDVGGRDQPPEHGEAPGCLQIEGE